MINKFSLSIYIGTLFKWTNRICNIRRNSRGSWRNGRFIRQTLACFRCQCISMPVIIVDQFLLQALLTNPKIDVERIDDVNKFVYKPPLDLKAPKKTSLLNLLKSRHEKCEGAVTVDDVRETIPSNKADIFIEVNAHVA